MQPGTEPLVRAGDADHRREEAPALSVEKRRRWLVGAVLGLILLAGTGVRLFDLGRKTITHPEIYVPGIDLPPEISEPQPKHTLWQAFTRAIFTEPHPPAYYMMMVPWVKMFGTSTVAIRLPSALFGIASIFLVYLLGTREAGKATGLLAAALLALNGHHVFWSQAARMYTPACFLGLLSSLLLLKLCREGTRPRGALLAYCLSTLAGLATVIFYWPIFIIQVLWVAVTNGHRAVALPLLRWQLLLFVLASPLCAVAAYQSWDPSYAVGEPLPFLGEYLQLGFLFDTEFQEPLAPLATAATLALDVVAVVLLGMGLASRSEVQAEDSILPGPPLWLMWFAAGVALGGILLYAGTLGVLNSRRIMSPVLIPLAAPVVDLLLRRYWHRLQDRLLAIGAFLPGGLGTLSGLLAVLPMAAILVVSLKVPLFVSRGVLLFTPYLLITLSRGLVALVRRDRRWLVLGPVLVVAHGLSVYYFYHRPNSPRDYKALAQELAARVQDTDPIFVIGSHSAPGGIEHPGFWQTTPIFYYLKTAQYHFVGKSYTEALTNPAPARIWVVSWQNNAMPADMQDALRGYDPGEQVEVRGAVAVLYHARKAPGS